MMTCRELTEFLADWESGDLEPDVRRRFEEHLLHCAACVRYVRGYETAVRLGRRAFDDADASVPGDVPEELVQAILTARARR